MKQAVFLVFLVLIVLGMMSGCSLSMDFHPDGKQSQSAK
jgi:uncharacterized protein YceK